MSKIAELRIGISNKYQSCKLIAVLEHNYPRLMKTMGVVSGVLTFPLRVMVWIAMGLSWSVDMIEAAIEYIGETAMS